jgi:hypothetical protein
LLKTLKNQAYLPANGFTMFVPLEIKDRSSFSNFTAFQNICGGDEVCYNFDTKEVLTVKYNKFKHQVLGLIRVPVARYCLIVKLVRVRS